MVSLDTKRSLVCAGLVLSNAMIAMTAHAERVSFIARRDFEVGRSPQSIAVGDFNGDGVQDLALANFGDSEFPGDVSVLLGNADGTLQPARSFRADAVLVPSPWGTSTATGYWTWPWPTVNPMMSRCSWALAMGASRCR